MKKSFAAALISLLCLSACASAQSPATLTGMELAGTSWRLVDADIPAGVQAPTITFGEDGHTAGNAGCNQWFATVESDTVGNLRFGAIGSTRRMCSPEAMEVERRFLDALAHTRAADHDPAMRVLRFIGDEADNRGTFEPWTPPSR